VQEARTFEPAGCIGPTLPLTAGELDPAAVVLVDGASTSGNVHSNASAAMTPGVWGTPSIVTC
jgi:hypothetical protein